MQCLWCRKTKLIWCETCPNESRKLKICVRRIFLPPILCTPRIFSYSKLTKSENLTITTLSSIIQFTITFNRIAWKKRRVGKWQSLATPQTSSVTLSRNRLYLSVPSFLRMDWKPSVLSRFTMVANLLAGAASS